MSVTRFTECGNSNRMEKYGFQKALHGIEARDVNIKQITKDRHVQIKKFMKNVQAYCFTSKANITG